MQYLLCKYKYSMFQVPQRNRGRTNFLSICSEIMEQCPVRYTQSRHAALFKNNMLSRVLRISNYCIILKKLGCILIDICNRKQQSLFFKHLFYNLSIPRHCKQFFQCFYQYRYYIIVRLCFEGPKFITLGLFSNYSSSPNGP